MSDNIKKCKYILIVSSDFVYPPNHGGRVDVWNKILCLNSLGFNIDLITTIKSKPKKEDIDIVKEKVNKLILIYRKNSIKDIFSLKPLQIKSRNQLKYIDINREYDYLLIEGTYGISILENKTLKVKKRILRMHNDEAFYFRQLFSSEKIWWKKFYYLLESYKFRIIDKKIIDKIPNIMFISYEELNKYKYKYPKIKAYFLPSAVNLNLKKINSNTKNVVFIGSLFMINNKEAINFYIKKIHPLLLDIKGYTFTIAGNSKGEGIEWIRKLSSKYNNINIIDSPETLDNIYANASVFVNPMLHGAGVKLKTINAIVNGLPVVSTTTGNQGTGLKHGSCIYVTDNAKEYAKYIKILLNDKVTRETMVRNSQEFISLYYNQEKILSKYLDEIGRF